jgi:hypothetical protein
LLNPVDDPNNIGVDHEVTFADCNAERVTTFFIAHHSSYPSGEERQLVVGWLRPTNGSPVGS